MAGVMALRRAGLRMTTVATGPATSTTSSASATVTLLAPVPVTLTARARRPPHGVAAGLRRCRCQLRPVRTTWARTAVTQTQPAVTATPKPTMVTGPGATIMAIQATAK